MREQKHGTAESTPSFSECKDLNSYQMTTDSSESEQILAYSRLFQTVNVSEMMSIGLADCQKFQARFKELVNVGA